MHFYKNILLKTLVRSPLNGEAIFAATAAMFVSFPALQEVKADPQYHYLQAIQQDNVAPHAFGVLDVHDKDGNLTGFIQINEPSGSDSQMWTEINDDAQTPAGVHLKNKATGLCIGDDVFNLGMTTLLNCGIGETFWLEIPHAPAPKGAIFERITKVTWPFKDIKACFGKDPNNPGTAHVWGCPKPFDAVVWVATNDPIGTVSSGSSSSETPPPPPPPPVAPVRPTDCEVSGTATCGYVGFSCHPLSASDDIVVSSGSIGVKVTSVQAQLGLVSATYLNPGKTSVEVCAIKSGMTACSDKIDVAFGPTVCTAPPPEPLCPTGQSVCRGTCQPFGHCHPDEH